ncbi:MAG: hypothetical protein Kow0025_17500 [Thermodesulfovibrionales bacterium]
MEVSAMINAMRDPMGVPMYPVVFQLLMVLTFVLHILFVNLTVGAALLAVYGRLKSDGNWNRLSGAMGRALPVNVSMAMLLGIAPLLFVQVIYDPFWYASNGLSAAWVIGFIAVMMAAYGFAYVQYLGGRDGKRPLIFGALAAGLFVLAGVIMHAIGYQSLQPDRWLGWYAGSGAADTTGTALHSLSLPRFLHFMVPSLAITGVFMMLYAWYFRGRQDMDADYLGWVGRTGARMAFVFTAVQALVGLWWLATLPGEFAFYANPFFIAGAGLGLGLLVFLYLAQGDPVKFAVPSALVAFLAVAGMSTAREVLRMSYAGRFDYSIFDYRVNMDLGSAALFGGTFVMGLVILAYMLTVAFKAGRVSGQYEAAASMHGWGRASVALLLVWIALVAGLGLVLTVRNYIL